MKSWQDFAGALNESLLQNDMARSGLEHFGDDRYLGCVLGRLIHGESITIATLGGSISAGSHWVTRRTSSKVNGLFHARLTQWANSVWPASPPHVAHNGAVPATGPGYFELCLESQLPAGGADLVRCLPRPNHTPQLQSS